MQQTTLTLESVLEAQRRIDPFVRRTLLLYSESLSALSGADVWLKLECQQLTGSFKVRGALNKVGLLAAEERARGIVTGSAGNHGLGVAYAARAWGGITADVYVPTNAPRVKVEKMRRLGVTVRQEGSTYEEAHQAAEAFARLAGATYVQAYDDLDVIAGQGTVALEILEDLSSAGLVDASQVLVPVGGGGLIAGVAAVLAERAPGCRVVGVQPEASPAALLSLRDGVAYDPYDHEPTLADGLAGGFGAIPLRVARELIAQVLLANEADLRRAIFYLIDQEQLVVEASGAIAIVPLLNGSLDVAGQRVVCILSGGNIETTLLRDILVEFTTH
jgi:threonine dehydratase